MYVNLTDNYFTTVKLFSDTQKTTQQNIAVETTHKDPNKRVKIALAVLVIIIALTLGHL